ncbi:MAG: DUF1800 domain-containing protein [Anaerolineae bacterium]|nr:DUF1800 domain-containing protein [Anaerolineae bacterium]
MNRRDFFKLSGTVGAGAALGLGGVPSAWGRAAFLAQPRRDAAAHVVHRLTFGPALGLLEQVRAMGPMAFIEQQLHPAALPDPQVEALLADFETLSLSGPEVVARYQADNQRAVAALELQAATLLRAVYSQRQLFELMVHFWSDHFNILLFQTPTIFLKPADDRDVIRAHALGNFRALLGASAASPAMLVYLDNASSNRRQPNENYARELLELHTLGVDGGYTEQDVYEVARAFTGWTIAPLRREVPNVASGAFYFDPRRHDDGEKVVLGQRIPAGGGLEDGARVLDILAAHPATARSIAGKLARRFVADAPPTEVIEAGAAAFLASGGEIVPVLRAIFEHAAFLGRPRPKLRRPYEYVVASLRALSADFGNPQAGFRRLRQTLEALGQVPFSHPAPDGFPDVASAWQDNLLPRWNHAITLTSGGLGAIQPDFDAVLAQLPPANDVPTLLSNLADYLLGRSLTPEEAALLQGLLGEADLSSAQGRQTIQESLALLLACPAFQYR